MARGNMMSVRGEERHVGKQTCRCSGGQVCLRAVGLALIAVSLPQPAAWLCGISHSSSRGAERFRVHRNAEKKPKPPEPDEDAFTLVDASDGLVLDELPLEAQPLVGLPIEEESSRKQATDQRRGLRKAFESELQKKGGEATGKPRPARSRKKGWLAGRKDSKRKKLDENSALEQWLLDSDVWLSAVPDWGREPHALSMAVETREEAENEISGRGLIARREIYANEELARVPERLLFTKEKARERFGSDILFEELSDWSCIATHLVWERYGEKESFWQPYLDVLPTVDEIGASWTWSEEEIDSLLMGSNLRRMSLVFKRMVVEDFEYVEKEVYAKHRDLFPKDVYTLERHIWAYSILFSRGVKLNWGEDDGGEILALVPYIDLINHNPNSDTFMTPEYSGVDLPLGLKERERAVVVRGDAYYKKYEQVYISYGAQSNANLLLLYGFSLERNQKDYVEMWVSQLLESENCTYRNAKVQFLDERNMQRFSFPLYRDRFPADMRQFLRVLVLTHEEVGLSEDASEKEFLNALRKVKLDEPVDELSERRAINTLQELLEDMLNAYSTTREEDDAALNDRSSFQLLPKNTRNAIRVRYLEKQIIAATLAVVKRIKATLGRITEKQAKEEERRKKVQEAGIWGRIGLSFQPDEEVRSYRNLDELLSELNV